MTADVRHATIALDALAPHPRNYRQHPDAQVERLAASVARFGQVRSIVVQEGADGRYLLVAGHGVALAAERHGLTQLRADVIPADWTAEQVEGYLIADNETARGAVDDTELLARLLQEQQDAGHDLASLGYDADALDALLADIAGDGGQHEIDDPDGGGDDFDTTPDESGPTRVQPGDLWQLGAHRLLCGDSTRREEVARLMGGETFRCIWTDPPYGVNHSGGSKDPRSASYRSGDKLQNDALGDPETQRLVTAVLMLAAEHGTAGASAYVMAPPGPLHRRFIAAMDVSGFTYRHQLIWVKDTFVFGRSDYHYRHEPILYGWLETGAHYFTDDRTHSSVFEIPRPKRSEEHPTMKPLPLVAAMVNNSTRDGDTVYDPFAGSGTTLIAADRLGRRCYAIEISPRYCDVIVRRWEAETGREATLLSRKEEGAA